MPIDSSPDTVLLGSLVARYTIVLQQNLVVKEVIPSATGLAPVRWECISYISMQRVRLHQNALRCRFADSESCPLPSTYRHSPPLRRCLRFVLTCRRRERRCGEPILSQGDNDALVLRSRDRVIEKTPQVFIVSTHAIRPQDDDVLELHVLRPMYRHCYSRRPTATSEPGNVPDRVADHFAYSCIGECALATNA